MDKILDLSCVGKEEIIYMALLYNIKLKNNEVVNGCYFIKYIAPVRGGMGNRILTYADKEIKCFDKYDNEILNKDFDDAEILKIYDEHSLEDVTEFYLNRIKIITDFFGNSFIREVVKLDW